MQELSGFFAFTALLEIAREDPQKSLRKEKKFWGSCSEPAVL